jgi:hypothetical protein
LVINRTRSIQQRRKNMYRSIRCSIRTHTITSYKRIRRSYCTSNRLLSSYCA